MTNDFMEKMRKDPMRAKCELSLFEFVKQSWHLLHPTTSFTTGWCMEVICEHLQAVTEGKISRLLINVPPGTAKSMLTSCYWPAWEWGPRGMPGMQYITASYDKRLSTRDMMNMRDFVSDPWFQKRWPIEWKDDDRGKEKYANMQRGFRYATSTGAGLTGWRGQRFIIDDPHSVKMAESEVERASARFWFTETTPTRFTDPQKPVYVVIMQRLHSADISGLIMANLMEEQDWTTLILPMEAELKYRSWTPVYSPFGQARMRRVMDEGDPCPYYVEDEDAPLLYLQDPRKEEGELMFPERFPKRSVDDLKVQLMVEGGDYAVACNPGEAPVLMSDLSMRGIDDVHVGDEVVGFHRKKGRRSSLTRAKVLATNSRRADVVRITFESGRSIRCTPDHRWYKRIGRNYSPANIGAVLCRVCPPEIEPIEPRLAGWLAGMFDADGGASESKHVGHKASMAISFYQSMRHNPDICALICRSLTEAGFVWSASGDDRRNAICYRILHHGLPGIQRFVHAVKPTKWLDRIIDGAYRAKFISAKERVVRIEPCGQEVVYSLETTTGNYIVWGLASSNCQLQQRPVPREGGMFKVEKITFVDEPIKGDAVRGWDLAASKDKTSPYTVGAKLIMGHDGRLCIADVTRLRGDADEVRSHVLQTATQDGFDCPQDIPQDPGQAGKAQVAQFAKDLHGFDCHFSLESGAKEQRAEPFAAQVNAGNVCIVRGAFNDSTLAELGLFPGSTFKDITDALSRAYHHHLKNMDDPVSLFGPRLIFPDDDDNY